MYSMTENSTAVRDNVPANLKQSLNSGESFHVALCFCNMTFILYFVIFIHGILMQDLPNNDCIFRECDCEGTTVLCYELNLKKIPDQVFPYNNSDYHMLDFEVNMITSIPAKSLPANLQELNLANNPVTTIDDHAFDNCGNTLKTLTFSNALFTRIPDAFLHLKQLLGLSISNTKILDWNPEALNSFGKTLQTLNMDICGLTNWPNWIQNFTNLTELSLSGNFISSLPDDALDLFINSLTSLSIANNRLTSVPKTLSRLNALTTLHLEQNKISDVAWLPQNSKLTSLTLNYNAITDAVQLSDVLYPYANSLSNLDIEDNRLTAIPDVDFLKLISDFDFTGNSMSNSYDGSVPSSTYSINLESNAFRSIPTVLFSAHKVTYMMLGSNQIADLDGMNFPKWTTNAELANNYIVELKDSSFPENSSLQYLYLTNNPISRISDNAFRNLPELIFLSLQYTKLTRMPLGLASAKGLRDLEFAGNPNLVCTCMEKDLQQWIMSMPESGVNGDCGRTSILAFYKDLSPLCP